MRVLLIHPPLREHYPPMNFPFGIAYVAQYLKKAGHDIRILDIHTNQYSRKKVLEMLDELKKFNPEVIGTGGIITVYKYLKWLIPNLRQRFAKAKIIVGGSLATSAPGDTLKNLGVDFIVIGEGEITAPELVNYLEKHRKPKAEEMKRIKGIGFKQASKIIITEPRELIKDLNTIDFPPWQLFPMHKLIKSMNNYMDLITERGCPFRCNFCYHQFGYISRRRSMENVVKEMKLLNKKYGIRKFSISDNLFVYNKNEVLKLIELLKKNNLKIKFDTSMRASLVTEELIKLLKAAGCIGLSFGFESGSQKVLNLMNKRTTVEQMDNAIRIMNKYKMPWFGSFIIGYPGETKKDIDQTIAFCTRNGIIAKPFFATPYPGTPLYAAVKDKIKDMNKFIESLGDARDLVINISDFSNEELMKQRRRVTEETEKAYLKKHRVLGLIFSPLKLLNIEVGFVVHEFLTTPFFPFLKKSFTIGFNYLRGRFLVPITDDGYDKTKNLLDV